jgi:hypothetical protein
MKLVGAVETDAGCLVTAETTNPAVLEAATVGDVLETIRNGGI